MPFGSGGIIFANSLPSSSRTPDPPKCAVMKRSGARAISWLVIDPPIEKPPMCARLMPSASMKASTSRSMFGVRCWRLPSGPTVWPWPRMSIASTRLVFAMLAPRPFCHPVQRRPARAVDQDHGRAGPHFEVVELRPVAVGPEFLLPAAGDERHVRQFLNLRERAPVDRENRNDNGDEQRDFTHGSSLGLHAGVSTPLRGNR